MSNAQEQQVSVPTVRKPQLHRKLRVLLAKVGATTVVVSGDDDTKYVVSPLLEPR